MVSTEEATCVGGVLRDLDSKSLLHSDFVLVFGDLVTNMKLDQALHEHRLVNAMSFLVDYFVDSFVNSNFESLIDSL